MVISQCMIWVGIRIHEVNIEYCVLFCGFRGQKLIVPFNSGFLVAD
jgi:hypothetical protein